MKTTDEQLLHTLLKDSRNAHRIAQTMCKPVSEIRTYMREHELDYLPGWGRVGIQKDIISRRRVTFETWPRGDMATIKAHQVLHDAGKVSLSLSEKLFIARVDLIGEIDQVDFETDGEALAELRNNVETRLFDEVVAMSLDNFIVRPKRKFVEKFQGKVAWQNLTPEARVELAEHIAGLPSAYEDDDLAAKQFDY